MNIHPSNDSFESQITENSAGFKVLDSRYIAYVMEALRYTLSGNCEYFLPVYNSECGVIIEPPVDIIISCEGAWADATVIAYYESSDPQNLINAADSAFSYVVDGVETELLPPSIERHVEVFYKEDNLALTSRVEITFINISAISQFIRLQLIKKANAILFYDSPNFNDRNPTLMRDDFGNFAVCLAPVNSSCIPSEPVSFTLDKTLYNVDPSLQYRLYAMIDGEIQSEGIYPEGEGDNSYISLGALDSFNGLKFDVSDSDNLFPDFCNEFGYEMECYLVQYVENWNSGASVGNVKIYLNGQEYLESEADLGLNHSFTFEEQEGLKASLAPFYTGIAEWMQTLGLDATYDPDMWGSYNSGGIKIKVTSTQQESFGVNSADGYALALGIRKSTAQCIDLIPFSELPNLPNTLIISPISGSEPSESVVTLLANHIPPEGEVNFLSLLGITDDISITSCSFSPS